MCIHYFHKNKKRMASESIMQKSTLKHVHAMLTSSDGIDGGGFNSHKKHAMPDERVCVCMYESMHRYMYFQKA